MKTILINGAYGKMGQETVKAIEADTHFTIVATLSHQDDLKKVLAEKKPDIAIDFTRADSVFENTKSILEAGVRPVIGTTGLSPEELLFLQKLALEKHLGGIIAPNFSIAAILMMRFSAQAARYFPDVEIIEMHHENKQDSPSGTAIKTAEMIAKTRLQSPPLRPEKAIIPGARGAKYQDIPIHALRLPGFIATQEVIFGGQGETLSIKDSTLSRSCFMPGVILACHKVTTLNALIYGLEEIIDTGC